MHGATDSTHAEALACGAGGLRGKSPAIPKTIQYEDDKGKWHTEHVSGETARIPSSRLVIRVGRLQIRQFEAVEKHECDLDPSIGQEQPISKR